MKILLIGPCPPPHGGISVHVLGIRCRLKNAGVACAVLHPGTVSKPRFLGMIALRAVQGWTLHVHTNGHNWRSWLLAFVCALASRFRGGSVLTLHSGMAPAYLSSVGPWRKRLAAFTCRRFSRVICVSPEIQRAVASLGMPPKRIEVVPAWLETERAAAPLEPMLDRWVQSHRPLFSTALFFRPEYGFELLIDALAHLRDRYPSLGCLVMGSGEQYAQAAEHIRRAGLDENVLLLGDVDHDRCLELISRSDVFLRGTFEDGDSISVREALSLGIPVVASRVGMRPEGTILFEPGNLEDMLFKINLAMAEQRVERKPSVSWMDHLMEIYHQVVIPGGAYVST